MLVIAKLCVSWISICGWKSLSEKSLGQFAPCHLCIYTDSWIWEAPSVSTVNIATLANDMMTSSNGNIFCITGPLCGEITGHRWIPCTKASDAELWCFLWSVPWINGWVNNRVADDLRCQRAHYNVIVIEKYAVPYTKESLEGKFYPKYSW